ncbi:MAG: ROK family protein [Clostridia bacterium]|nr:ROK family protein [Clostridia bacterium]
MEKQVNHGQQLIKENNEKLLFKLVREHTTLSRADLKRLTGLSPTTVSSLADDLIAKGLFIETGIKEVKSSGRKATLMEIKPDGGYFICADVGKKITTVECLDLNFKVTRHFETETTNLLTLAEKIKNTILSFASKPDTNVIGVVIGVSAIVKHSRIISSSSLLNTEGADEFVEILSTALEGVPFYLQSDSNMKAYAETIQDKNLKDIISIDIDDGVGAGILLKGRIFSGHDGAAGEFGHMSIDINGPVCTCGNKGCLEPMISIPAIVKRAHELDPSIENFSQIVCNTDKFHGLICEIAEYLSYGIINLANLFNPQEIVIIGPITRLGDTFLEHVREFTYPRLTLNQAKISYSTVPGNPVTVGCAKYAFDHILI